MDLPNPRLFSMTAKKLDWLSKRQIVLSQNLANADTPSYAPRDLKPLGFGDLLRRKDRPPGAGADEGQAYRGDAENAEAQFRQREGDLRKLARRQLGHPRRTAHLD
ncbi:MAG: hypothetical protein VW547_17980 [Alphaproteobacteria bacterium]